MTTTPTRITILIDNQAVAGCEAEHGFSLWLETGGRRLLFDTGQGEAFIGNAATLGIDPGLADTIVLSHGHYDHSGGLPQILRRARKADLYCHPAVVSSRYSIRNGTPKDIRMPSASLIALDRLPLERLHWMQRPHPLSGTIGLSGPIPRVSGFEDTGGPFFLDRQGQRPDPIDDDLALWVRTEGGLIVVVGCAHAGLVNTLLHARRCNDDLPIRAVIGGFHLLNAASRRLEQTIAALRELSPERIVPCHCTGGVAVTALRHAFGDRVLPGAAGARYIF
jgi:7,8-dihydropterin-6-yl-methyl-4-(beta-D-ribofuranosyl)aminobenzene 5'-phosphate synthase